ncbi:MAG: hypothetical protein Q8R82_22155, partial [Hyphomonadaceae bacterium]|nr:hypothetical protein [Hyphomonadaceae bacterium]
MTRHKHAQTGLGTPSPLDRWIDAMLCVFAMLVQFVVSTFQMNRRHARVNARRAMPAALPRVTSDTIKETSAAKHRSPIALTLRDREAIVSKDEGVLTTVSHNSPSPSVSRAPHAIHLPLRRRGRQTHRRLRLRGIASTAEGGGGGLRALARKTEGAHAHHPLS